MIKKYKVDDLEYIIDQFPVYADLNVCRQKSLFGRIY